MSESELADLFERPPRPRVRIGVGAAVVLVLADSRALAEDAAELVEVEYDPLDAVVDPREAPELLRFEKTAGDVDGAFAAAAHVVAAHHEIPRVAAVPMETRGTIGTQL